LLTDGILRIERIQRKNADKKNRQDTKYAGSQWKIWIFFMAIHLAT
jgi:hypothetical protein